MVSIIENAESLFFLILIWAVILQALLSWIMPLGPGNRFMVLLGELTDPILMPLRRTIPPLGMFDLSPLIAIVILYILRSVFLSITGTLAGGG